MPPKPIILKDEAVLKTMRKIERNARQGRVSSLRLSIELYVSHATAKRRLHDMEQRGLVIRDGKKGYRVNRKKVIA